MTKAALRIAALALLAGSSLLFTGCVTQDEAADEGEPVYIPEEAPDQQDSASQEPSKEGAADTGPTAEDGEVPPAVAESEPGDATPLPAELARIAVGPRAGQKVFTLQSVAAQPERAGHHGAAEAGGFSLHAGLDIQPGERAKLERLCRYVSRPPVSTERLALTPSGQVRYQLKTPYRDGTTHLVLEPLDLMARLAALVPPPRMHLTRYHGVFAPHSTLRAAITPAGRGAGGKGAKQGAEAPAVPKHVAMGWAQRLKRVFAIEIETCVRCQGRLRVIASIEEPEVIARILAHRERDCGAPQPELAPIAARAPPRQARLL